MSIRGLFAVLIGLAVLFAPAMTTAAMAGPGPAGHIQMMDHSGHCQMPFRGPSDHHKSDGKSCCVSLCMAVAVQPQSAAIVDTLPDAAAQFSAPAAHLAYLGEIATPPPRNA